jgi:hypothetical protein
MIVGQGKAAGEGRGRRKGRFAMQYSLSLKCVVDVLRVLNEHFRARGYSDAWLLALAEDAISNWRWGLARRAVDVFWFAHSHELEGWEREAVNYIYYLLTLEDIVHRNEIWRGVAESEEELEELPL